LQLELPADDEPVAWALFAHCFTCDAGIDAARRIARAFAAERIAVARLDVSGRSERAEADSLEAPVMASVFDLERAASALDASGRAPMILVGHSIGATALMVAAPRIASARALITIGAPVALAEGGDSLAAATTEVQQRGAARLALGTRPSFTITRDLIDALHPPAVLDALRSAALPLLVFHSPTDAVVPIGQAKVLFTAAQHPKSFVALDDADHMLSNPRDAEFAAEVAASWVRRYVDVQPHRARSELEQGTRVATRTTSANLRTEIMAGGHPLVADEPASVGGSETGPTPYDLLAAALGACTSMTLQMYAKRKGWPLEEAVVRLEHRKVHALDEEGIESSDPRLDHVDRELELIGDLSEEQRRRLAEIADRCPVHRTMERGVRISTELKG
jgi:uncharacterized OsmC-like protein/pimeloyl-ACP methyl ester carboxylesterase